MKKSELVDGNPPNGWATRRRAVLSYFVLLALMMSFAGCPEPLWLPMKFKFNAKRTKTFHTIFENNSGSLTIKGQHNAHRGRSALIQIQFEFKFKRGASDEYKFVLNAPKLIFEEVILPYESFSQIYKPKSNKTQELLAPFPGGDPYYVFSIDSETYSKSSQIQKGDSAILKLVLEDFIFYRDSALHLDTIYCYIYKIN